MTPSKTRGTTAIAAAGTGPSSAIASTSAAKEPETRAPRKLTVNASLPAAISSSSAASGEDSSATIAHARTSTVRRR